MRFKSYNQELKFALCQIIDVFNNIEIYRFDQTNMSIAQTIVVPCIYGARNRILKSAENANFTLKPPLTTFILKSVRRDERRVHTPHATFEFNSGSNSPINNIGIPVTLSYEFSIMAKYQDDVDQILSNFAVHFNPDIYVVWPNPYGTGQIKSQITWDGSISMSDDEISKLPENSPWRISPTMNFEYKTWLFPGMSLFDSTSGYVIDKINLNGYSGAIYGMDKYYVAPTIVDFEDYKNSIISGYVDANTTSDWLPISG